MALEAKDFAAFFKAVHGHDPFPWQTELARQVIESGCWPKLLDLPTGVGKTAAIDIAVFHLACEAAGGAARRAPLRILFVVDRRIVVDAAAERAKEIAKALTVPARKAAHPILNEVTESLARLSGDPKHPLDVVRLRGGVPQERDWARSPAQPLVAVSTVDQVGSRLLFRGYGVSTRMWPVHAGLVGSDALWLLDEVHLSQPLEQTLGAIEDGHRLGALAAQPRLAPFAVVKLSATPGQHEAGAFVLTEGDRAHSVVARRLGASKIVTLVQMDKAPAESCVDAVLQLLNPVPKAKPGRGRKKAQAEAADAPSSPPLKRIAVVVNRVDLARAVFDRLRAHAAITGADGEAETADVLLLTGRVRPLDRRDILEKLKLLFAGEKRTDPPKPIILVATQTIEAGADFDFDALVTEIAPLDSLRQRFGRLDRLGLRGRSAAVILHPKGKPGRENDWAPIGRIYGKAAYETKEWLAGFGGAIDFGINALEPKLAELAAQRDEDGWSALLTVLAPRANAPSLLAPPYTDLWATTWPAPAATPKPEAFLHGPGNDADVQVVWRADVDPNDEYAANVSLAHCPPSAQEALPVPAWAVRRWLQNGDAEIADVPSQAQDAPLERTSLPVLRRSGERWQRAWAEAGDDARRISAGDLIVVPANYGGCDAWGWNPASKAPVADRGLLAHYRQRRKGVIRATKKMLAADLGSADVAADSWEPVHALLEDESEPDATMLWHALSEMAELPSEWRALLDAMEGRKFDVAPYDLSDWSKGFVLYCDKRLPDDLLGAEGDDTEDEEDGADAITDRDDSWATGEEVSLAAHTQHVTDKARGFAERAGLPVAFVDLIALAARLHDLGKAEPRFQADLRGTSALFRGAGAAFLDASADVPPLAKSGRTRSFRRGLRAAPTGFRHEALSVALAEQHPEVQTLDAEARDLVLWLIGTHHGYGRPFFPAVTDTATDACTTLPLGLAGASLSAKTADAPLRLDQGWFERAERVRRRFGPWELARLEAILRLADHAASAQEQEASQGEQERVVSPWLTSTPAPALHRAESADTVLPLKGLEPDNLLAFLALLGLLRALDAARPEWHARIAWRGEPPVAELKCEARELCEDDVAEVVLTAFPTLESSLRWFANKTGLIPSRRGDEDVPEEREADAPSAKKKNALSNSERVALYAQLVQTVVDNPSISDPQQSRREFQLSMEAIAALARLTIRNGEYAVEDSPLKLPSGQQAFVRLIRQFVSAGSPSRRGRNALPPEHAQIKKAIFSSWSYQDQGDSLRLSPYEDRRYAYRFNDPSPEGARTERGANILAAVGLLSITLNPGDTNYLAIGYQGERNSGFFTWPLWESFASLTAIVATMRHPELSASAPRVKALESYGIRCLMRCRRYVLPSGQGDYGNVSPAVIVA